MSVEIDQTSVKDYLTLIVTERTQVKYYFLRLTEISVSVICEYVCLDIIVLIGQSFADLGYKYIITLMDLISVIEERKHTPVDKV